MGFLNGHYERYVPAFLPTPAQRRRVRYRKAKETAAGLWASAPLRWTAMGLAAYGAYRVIQKVREEDLRDQVVLITGGSRGLGFLLAKEFLREGCRVAICGRDEETLRRARHKLESGGAEILALRCDLADPAAINELVAAVSEHFGGIDILVNNAGAIQVGPLDAVDEDDFANAMDLMFWAPLRTTRAVLPQMRARGTGRIVNITSIGGMISVPHLLPYNCAKFAAVGLSQGLRAELASDGIRVTTIVPGVMRVGSYLNAEFRGRADREYQWFALGSAVPGPSMCGERAARQILRAVKRGDAFRTLGMPAAVAERVNGLMPGTVARVMSLVGRLMPRRNGAGPGEIKTGWQAAQETDSRAFDAATAAGYNAAERTNQLR